jgi:cytochrome c oxidase subunit 2
LPTRVISAIRSSCPRRDVVAGYEPIMPSFQGQLDEGELAALISFLKENK